MIEMKPGLDHELVIVRAEYMRALVLFFPLLYMLEKF